METENIYRIVNKGKGEEMVFAQSLLDDKDECVTSIECCYSENVDFGLYLGNTLIASSNNNFIFFDDDSLAEAQIKYIKMATKSSDTMNLTNAINLDRLVKPYLKINDPSFISKKLSFEFQIDKNNK